MKVIIFCGPTVTPEEVKEVLPNATIRPPVSQGDIYLAGLENPHSIGIIDGYFECTPSVWHKEILWAIGKGIRVFGSSSMGALRAAELHQYGMIGVGKIFEGFRNGEFEDDDEVAVIHGPAELNYIACSDAMVNIRETLFKAKQGNMISSATQELLLKIGKELFFSQRTYRKIFEMLPADIAVSKEICQLKLWLSDEKVDLKRKDALDMLSAIGLLGGISHSQATKSCVAGSVFFEPTLHWAQLINSLECHPVTQKDSNHILRELIKNDSRYLIAQALATLSYMASLDAQGQQPGKEYEFNFFAEEFCTRNNLTDEGSVNEWLLRNNLELNDLQKLINERVSLEYMLSKYEKQVENRSLIWAGWLMTYPDLVKAFPEWAT